MPEMCVDVLVEESDEAEQETGGGLVGGEESERSRGEEVGSDIELVMVETGSVRISAEARQAGGAGISKEVSSSDVSTEMPPREISTEESPTGDSARGGSMAATSIGESSTAASSTALSSTVGDANGSRKGGDGNSRMTDSEMTSDPGRDEPDEDDPDRMSSETINDDRASRYDVADIMVPVEAADEVEDEGEMTGSKTGFGD